MKQQDSAINIPFGGGCPICGGRNTLTSVVGRKFFCVECSVCESKIELHSYFGLPLYKLIEGSSEYRGEELTLNEWKKVREGKLDNMEVKKRRRVIKDLGNLIKLRGIIALSWFIAIMIVGYIFGGPENKGNEYILGAIILAWVIYIVWFIFGNISTQEKSWENAETPFSENSFKYRRPVISIIGWALFTFVVFTFMSVAIYEKSDTMLVIFIIPFIVGLIQIAESVAFGIAKFKYKNKEEK